MVIAYTVVLTPHQKLYEDKVGNPELIELLKDSGEVDTKLLKPQKVCPISHSNLSLVMWLPPVVTWHATCPSQGYIQVTYVEPYFDDWELSERVTVFDRSFNIRKLLCTTHWC